MKKVISHLFSFIKQLFLRLRLVITLSIGRDKENERDAELDEVEDSSRKESNYDRRSD